MSSDIIFKDSFLHTILLIDTFVLTTTLVLLSTVEIFSVIFVDFPLDSICEKSFTVDS